jgi:hypothetical protein
MFERIESLDDPGLDVFRDLKSENSVRDARLFVAEGIFCHQYQVQTKGSRNVGEY